MYLASVASLLRAIGRDRNALTIIENFPQRDGTDWFTVTARSAEGEVWRSHHSNLLLAVVMLERLMKAGGCCEACEDSPERNARISDMRRF